MPGRWPGIRVFGWMRPGARETCRRSYQLESPGAALNAGTPLAGAIGGIVRPLGRRHEVVASAVRHDHIPRYDPQLTAGSGFAFQDVAGPDREPRRKPRLQSHDIRSVRTLRTTNDTTPHHEHPTQHFRDNATR